MSIPLRRALAAKELSMIIHSEPPKKGIELIKEQIKNNLITIDDLVQFLNYNTTDYQVTEVNSFY